MPRNSTHHTSPETLTFHQTAQHFGASGGSFSLPCPVCGHALVDISRGRKDSLRVQCDRGCPRKKIVEALAVSVRDEAALPSQGQLMLPFPEGSHSPQRPDLPDAPQYPDPLARREAPGMTVTPDAAVTDGGNAMGEIIARGGCHAE